MVDWRDEVRDALAAVVQVAELAGETIALSDIKQEYLGAPHRPPTRLPTGYMAIYGFWGDGEWLKVGRAGPKSNARYASIHYTGNAQSTLLGSLMADPHMLRVSGFDPRAPRVWIETACHRVNILMPARMSRELLSLLEAFLHVRLRPRYEGKQ
jgi:hypothetical protein